MAVNKVEFPEGNTIIDITDSTVTPQTLLSGATAYNKAGNKITGDVVVEHVEVEPVLNSGTKTATITVGSNSADIYCENVKAEVKNMKTPHSADITDGVATFDCIEANYVKSLKTALSPIQDLNGYDHPWAGGNGKNKIPSIEQGAIDTSGAETTQNNRTRTGWCNATAGTTYTASVVGGVYVSTVNFYDSNKTYLDRISYTGAQSSNVVTFEAIANTAYIRIVYRSATSSATEITPEETANAQLEEGSTATSYEPYSNICPISGHDENVIINTHGEETDTHTISFPQTVYGGSHDVIEGGVSSEWVVVDMGSINYMYINNAFRFDASNGIVSGIIGNDATDSICSVFPIQSDTVMEITNLIDGHYAKTATTNASRFYFKDDRYTTVEDFKNAYAGQTFCYKLATPTTLTTTPTDIPTFEGTNEISASSGAVEECNITELATIEDIQKDIPSGGGIDYSTEEQDTGLKWIDGRSIYQKTYVVEITQYQTVLDSNPSIDIILSSEGCCINPVNGLGCLGTAVSNDNRWYSGVHLNSQNILYMFAGSEIVGSGSYAYVTIKYVKPMQ